jgi:predicted alpha/beta-fold hydrolase
MLLKFLAEFGSTLPVRAAASVSAPIDLAAASRRFLAPRNRLYHRHLLRSMKAECEAGAAVLSGEERARVRAARSIYEFDDVFVAPRNGFRDAEHYYAENGARRFLRDVRIPTLLVHARDDPWIPVDVYESYAWQDNECLRLLLSPGGGHVGFHGRTRHQPWHDHWIDTFFTEHGL